MSDSDTNTTPTAEVPPEIVVRVFGRTDVGLVREHNEDNFLIADLTCANRSILPEVRTHRIGPRGSVFTVCDGMGGAAAGEVASRIGIDTIYEILQGGETPVGDVGLAQRLNDAICEAGTRIFTAAKLNRGQRGMGTTVTAAALNGPRLIIGQVGDSRAHVVRRGALVQVTKDQSLVQQLIDAKQLTNEEAKEFDRSNIILQALGTTEEVHVDVTSVMLRRGDALVMCSDGLSGRVEPDAICRVVTENDEPMDACRVLTELACENGGDDNITVIVARFDGAGLPECAEGELVTYERFEYRQVTETTARASLSRFNKEAEAQPDKAATKPVPVPAPAADAPTAGPPVEDATAKPASPKRQEPPAPEKKPVAAAEKSHVKVVVGVLTVLIACAGIGYFLLRGNGSDGAALATPGASDVSAVPAAPLASPMPAMGMPRVTTPASEPRLAPIAEDRIIGSGEEPKAAASAVKKDPKDVGSGGVTGTSKKKEVATEKKAEPPAPKKKKPESNIEENPY